MKEIDEIAKRLNKASEDMYGTIHNPSFRTLETGLWILLVCKEELRINALSADKIAEVAIKLGKSVKSISIKRAFAYTVGKVHGDETGYQIMKKGEEHLSQFIEAGDMQLMYVDGQTPRTAKKSFEAIFSKAKGTVKICDPWYGIKTLDMLERFDEKTKVQFLTSTTNDPTPQIQVAIRDFKKEMPLVEIRIYPNPTHLHDRYILEDKKLNLLGHSLNGFGGKESFVIQLDEKLCKEIKTNLESVFNRRWQQSKPI